jgi:hypothetical protein
MDHDDKLTGWTFVTPTDASGKPISSTTDPLSGGLVLQQMRHDGHNFAREIRLVGIWLEIEMYDELDQPTHVEWKLRTLDAAMGFTVSAVRKLEPTPIVNHPGWKEKFEWLEDFDDALQFSDYIYDPQGTYSGYGVSVTYDAPDLLNLVGYPNCELAGLTVEQVCLFSRYSDEPPHEPSGFLVGARCHPLVRFQFKPNPAFDPTKPHSTIASIRFDYRLHLYLDSHFATTNAPQNPPGTKNQAGLFADRDSPGFHGLVHQTFTATEKPVVLEVTAPGLVMGYHDSSRLPLDRLDPLYKVECWDNVHWWGLRFTTGIVGARPQLGQSFALGQGPVVTYPSAPGAFHAAHIHWRWGALLGILGGELARYTSGLVDTGPHFTPGTPLVDPRIRWQTIRVAVTKNDRRFDPTHARLVDLTKMNWEWLFDINNSPAPQRISSGDDIVLWYSAQVHGQIGPPRQGLKTSLDSGTVFLHGIFFAHDPEIETVAVGSTSAEYFERSESEIVSERKWLRPPET